MNQEAFISIVVVFFNMKREAPRTLYTLTPEYQGVAAEKFEVIAIDNGSAKPLDQESVESLSPNFKLLRIENAEVSPAAALNLGAMHATGSIICFHIDGARMLSPGILRYAILSFKAFSEPLVTTLGFHLGPDNQTVSIMSGYNQDQEDQLLDSVDWRSNGYHLFEISSLAGSSKYGWFMPAAESNCLFLKRKSFERLNGFSTEFDLPGGGLLNLDFYHRACNDPQIELVHLLGEGTFHQFHGGAMTGKRNLDAQQEYKILDQQYHRIRGKNFSPPLVRGHYVGHSPKAASHFFSKSAQGIAELRAQDPQIEFTFEKDQFPFINKGTFSNKRRNIIVLGMHRSGTSMLTGTLRQAGVALGDVNLAAPFNRKGNMEHPAIMHMQEDLLEKNGGSWDTPPTSPLIWQPMHTAIRDLFISQFASESIWAFKDPRTLFTLEKWLEVLPDSEFVGVFRSPVQVAQSLNNRNQMSFEDGFALWSIYNEKLLELHNEYAFPPHRVLYFIVYIEKQSGAINDESRCSKSR